MKLTEADVKAMDENDLYTALSLIKREIKRREEGGFAEVVSAYLRKNTDDENRKEIEGGGGAVKLTFTSDRWDDGFFYNEHSGVLTLADGTEVEMDFFHTSVHDALTELSVIARHDGDLDADSQLVVDLRTGAVEHR